MTYCDYKSERERLAREAQQRRKVMSDTTDNKFKEEVKYSLTLLRQPQVLAVLVVILVFLAIAAVAA